MHALRVNHQTNRRIPHPPRPDRAQKGILDPHQRHPMPRGHRLTAPRIARAAPNHHAVLGAGQAKVQIMPRQLQNPAQTARAQETGGVIIKPPGNCPGDLNRLCCAGQAFAQGVPVAVDRSDAAAPAEPVIADRVFCHCTKGASVT